MALSLISLLKRPSANRNLQQMVNTLDDYAPPKIMIYKKALELMHGRTGTEVGLRKKMSKKCNDCRNSEINVIRGTSSTHVMYQS